MTPHSSSVHLTLGRDMVSSKYKTTAEIPRSNFDNAGSIPATSTMKQPDAKKHFYVSILKSTVRIVGYALIPFNITAAVSTLIISEAIGIIEETV